METDNNSLKLLRLDRVARDKGKSSNRIHVDVSIETIFENLEIAKFSSKDITNLKTEGNEPLNILLFRINLVPRDGDLGVTGVIPEPLSGEFKIEKGKDVQFEFDNDENSILIIEAKISGTRPDGTKRKVITYDDCDEIDEAVK